MERNEQKEEFGDVGFDEKKSSAGIHIEIRDTPTRRFTDVRPSWWLRNGTAIIAVLFTIVAVAIAFLPYPHAGGRKLWEILLSHVLA